MPTSRSDGDRRQRVISGDHDRADVNLAADAHRFPCLVAGRVHHPDQAEECEIALDRFLLEAVGTDVALGLWADCPRPGSTTRYAMREHAQRILRHRLAGGKDFGTHRVVERPVRLFTFRRRRALEQHFGRAFDEREDAAVRHAMHGGHPFAL